MIAKDIANSNYEYSCAMLRQQTLNGYFTPGVFISTDFDSFGQKNFFEKNSTVAASLGYEQKIISGTSFKAVTNYSLYTDNIKRDKYIQNPSLSFVFIQSLKPYWLQGKKKDPIREQYALEKKYSYYKYECSKIIAIQNLVEYFFNIKICNTKLKYIQNQINLCNIKLDSLKKMRENGSINVNDEIATEKDILKYSEDLASIKISGHKVRCWVE